MWLWTWLLFAAPAQPAPAQHPAPPALRFVAADWGLRDLAAVRQGRLSRVRSPRGDELALLALVAEEPRPAGPAPQRSRAPEPAGSCFVLHELDRGNRNRLGGWFGVFQRRPSSASAEIDEGEDGRRALALTYHREEQGFAGLWGHFYDFKTPRQEQILLDARQLSFLTLWVRGRTGREAAVVRLADAALQARDDSLPLGDLGSFLPSGSVTRDWQRAVIPLQGRALDLGRLAGFSLETSTLGEGTLWLRGLALCSKPRPLPRLPRAARSARTAPRRGEMALWVWNTEELAADAGRRLDFLAFLRRHGFTAVFLQLPVNRSEVERGEAAELRFDLAAVRGLVADLKRLGVAVHALDGDRRYALPQWRPKVLAGVRQLAAHNASAPAGERFDGVHFDVEPYLLPGFGGPRRGELLADYLKLLEGVREITAPAGLDFGVDIPFWYDSPDELTGEPPRLEVGGVPRLVSELVIDRVDHVVLMDYRTSAYGPDGVVANAEGELRYASSRRKKVLIGLETFALPDEEYLTFRGAPAARCSQAGPAEVYVLMEGDPSQPSVRLVPADSAEEEGALGEGLRLCWPVVSREPVLGDRLSFAGLGASRLRRVMRQTGEELAGSPAFGGFAIHFYESYRTLVEQLGAQTP